MVNKLILILLLLVIKQSESGNQNIFYESSAKFCNNYNKTELPCMSKEHSIKCKNGKFCAINNKFCEQFDSKDRDKSNMAQKNKDSFEQFKQKITKCDLKSTFCENHKHCTSLILKHGKQCDCKDLINYSKKCEKTNYCGIDSSSCQLISKLDMKSLNNTCSHQSTTKTNKNTTTKVNTKKN